MEVYRLIGIGAFVVMSIALTLLIMRWPLGIHQTFSQHAAQSKRLSIYYFSIFATTMPLLWLFVTFYLMPKLSLPVSVSVLFGLTVFSQIVCTLFPEKGKGSNLLVHRIFAGISALLMFPTMYIISETTRNNTLSLVGWLGLVAMAITIIFVVHFRERFSLIAQIVYYTAFFIALFVFSFITV